MKKIEDKRLSIEDFYKKFPAGDKSDKAAIKYVERLFWGKKPICPWCTGTDTTPRLKRKGHRCNPCRKDFSIRTNSIFAHTKLPIRKWLFALYQIQVERKGVSSLQLSQQLDVCYKTAWFLSHHIRECCSFTGFFPSGLVPAGAGSAPKVNSPAKVYEVDEAVFGGKESNKHENKKLHAGRGSIGKLIAGGIKQREGFVVLTALWGAKKADLHPLIFKNVPPGSKLMSDEWRGYWGLKKQYKRGTTKHSVGEYVNGTIHTNSIEAVWSVLKRGYNGVYHKWSVKHFQRYLDEFVFRQNQGNCAIPVMDRLDSWIRCTRNKQMTFKELLSWDRSWTTEAQANKFNEHLSVLRKEYVAEKKRQAAKEKVAKKIRRAAMRVSLKR